MAEERPSREEVRAIRKLARCHDHSGFMGGGYGLALIGAAVYYVQQSDGFWMGVLGILKAIVWPAMLIYKVFTMIGM
jgi:hypothetical protein